MMWTTKSSKIPNVQIFVNENGEEVVSPIKIGGRYTVYDILSVSGGFGVILKAKDTRLGDRTVLVKARRYDKENGLFSYEKDRSRIDRIEKIRKVTRFEYNCLIDFKTLGEGRIPNVNDIVEDFCPSIYGPHLSTDGKVFVCTDYVAYNEPYIIMQMINGINLGEYLKSGIRNIMLSRNYKFYKSWERDVLQYSLQLATILGGFHKKDKENYNRYYIYQDLKPENIIITDDLFLTLLDFGAMTMVIEDNQGNARSNIEGCGSAGVGTWGYKAPEMNNPSKLAKLDRRVDIYSLGATMYHMLTGENLSLTLKDEYGRIPVDNLKKFSCTEYTYNIVKKCTEYNANERYNDMIEAKNDIYKSFMSIRG
ncbi:protein kinase domain-containing protein [Clostridium disporicum]|uniref:Protein kinase family protein n=1 Tax=Clostridium disporicum TaxID=84024 RepID=A0A173XX32_9CLOT|nr:protein kinase [Clostridium disporicum]CUN54988.1 protein kinase family protein [Clostridium disporicum]